MRYNAFILFCIYSRAAQHTARVQLGCGPPHRIPTKSVMPNTHRRRDETVLSRRRRRCEHNSQLAHDDCRRIRLTIIWKLTKQTP